MDLNESFHFCFDPTDIQVTEVEFLCKLSKSTFSFYCTAVIKTCGQKTKPTLGVLIKISCGLFV